MTNRSLCANWLRWLARFRRSGWLDAPVGTVYPSDALPQPPRRKPPRQANGEARIAATVTAIYQAGQDIKPHMLWVSRPDPLILNTQCSTCPEFGCEKDEGRENRESNKSLAQAGGAINDELRRCFFPQLRSDPGVSFVKVLVVLRSNLTPPDWSRPSL
jgi:hypothetical protein